ncbi:MAG: short-chain dehydrogenase/reductase [Capsulimonas sp.]|jgi:NAD(P)-dependent dehydrogenase (short-subunit alcohol dehydrogenase family)|nr:short-chain dehydrogenase/reductase [Capsulimonas sp.]
MDEQKLSYLDSIFDIKDKTVVITGASSDLGRGIARGFGLAGAQLILVSRSNPSVLISELAADNIVAFNYQADVMDRDRLHETAATVEGKHGPIDVLINMAGGNRSGATTSSERTFFDLSIDEIEEVIALNLFGGAIIPCQSFGRQMTKNPNGGSIINISSMAATRPLTRIVGYAAAKAAVENFTKWLAVSVAQGGSPKLRVNAIAPGFFLSEQNRYLLYDERGQPRKRCESIIEHTPMGRLGSKDDLLGAALFLASAASAFVTGTVIAVDGGFGAFSGV